MSLDEVRQMQGMKTGALIQFAAVAGGIHGVPTRALRQSLRAMHAISAWHSRLPTISSTMPVMKRRSASLRARMRIAGRPASWC